MSRLKQETLNGVKWGVLQKMTLQPLQLVYGMVLARLITPAEMGIVGLTAIFFALAHQLASAGFGMALIRKLDRTEEDMNTMFWFNIVMSFIMGLLLFLLAPWFAEFYKQPELLWLTRVSAVMMFLNSSASVHWTLYQCRRDFKTPAIINTITVIAGMPVCLTLAWMGWGVWALMWQGIFTSVLSLIIVWRVSPWKPRFMFSKASFLSLFSFGGKIAYGGILDCIYFELHTFVIGKFYSPAQLGLYSRGNQLGRTLPMTLQGVLGNVMYPVLSTVQNDNERLVSAYRKYIKACSLIISWFTVWTIAMAEPAVKLMYGVNWMGCVIFVQIIAFRMTYSYINTINVSLLMVKGKAGLLLGLEIVKKSISVLTVLLAASISVEAICWGSAIVAYIALLINSYFVGKECGLTSWRQQKDFLPYIAWAAISCVPAWLCTMTDLPAFLQLLIGGCTAFLLYFGGLHLFRDSIYVELYQMARRRLGNRWLPPMDAGSPS